MPLDPVLQLGPIPIHWYGLAYAIAFLVGFRLVIPFLNKRGVPERDANSLVWWCIVIGLVGARLYFVVQQPNLIDYLQNPVRIIAVWEGGMAFFGAIIGVVSTVLVFAYVKHLNVWLLLDGAGLFGTLPHAIGRVGNVINGDILGPPSGRPWAIQYTSPHTFAPQVGVGYQPAGAYEMVISLGIFAAILLLIRLRPRPGIVWISWCVLYGVSQFVVFFVRATEPQVLYGLKQAQLSALALVLVAVPAMALLRYLFPDAWASPRPASRPAGRARGEAAAVEPVAAVAAPEAVAADPVAPAKKPAAKRSPRVTKKRG
jgi:phosphatidylglycerol:prolipoprotein diacylglycerol transferase